MNKEQALRTIFKEHYLLLESKIFEKLAYEVIYNPYIDRTIIFYNVLDEEKDLNLVDILHWYWGDAYGFDGSPISVEELDKLIWDKEYALTQFLVRKEEK